MCLFTKSLLGIASVCVCRHDRPPEMSVRSKNDKPVGVIKSMAIFYFLDSLIVLVTVSPATKISYTQQSTPTADPPILKYTIAMVWPIALFLRT